MFKFSIIIPCYNDGILAVDAINSCLRQTYQSFEVIFVDDGSTDDSLEHVRKIFSNNKKVILLGKANGGLSSARNFGFQRCSGGFIVFLDSDDLLNSNFLENANRIIDKNYSINSVYVFPFAYFNLVDSCDRSKFTLRFRPPVLGRRKWFNLLKLATTNCFPVSAAVISRKLFMSNNGFDESLSCYEDWDFWLRLAKNGCNFNYDDSQFDPSTLIRIRAGMSSNTEKMKTVRATIFFEHFNDTIFMIFSQKPYGNFFRKIFIGFWRILSMLKNTPNRTS